MGWDEMKEKFKKAGDEMLIALRITIAYIIIQVFFFFLPTATPTLKVISLILPPAIMFVAALGILIYVDSDSDTSD
jgi:uncharacterized membrane protein YhdT